LAKKLCWATLAAAAALLSGCQSQVQVGGGDVVPKGASWAEQRQRAASILARYPAAAGLPSASVSAGPADFRGTAIEKVVVDSRATRLTVTFTGSPEPATSRCGADYSAEAVESTKAVVIIVLEQRNQGSGPCTMMGMTRNATVNLAQPLGRRAVLDVQEGQPVPVTTVPPVH
jgi:hypothetical protein